MNLLLDTQTVIRHPLDLWRSAALKDRGFEPLSITIDHALAAAALPDHHADPFDRILIAQATVEQLAIMTSDTAFDASEVVVLDART